VPRVKVLIVDDFKPFLQFISSMLRETQRFEVIHEASDGLEAVRLAQELQPDFILLDIGLPELNGIEAGRRIRKVSPNSKILFVSQESSVEVVQETLRLGARGYVHKLHAQSELLPAIETVLRGDRYVSHSLKFSDGRNDPTPYHHDIVFCPDDATIVDSLTRFIATALNAGNAAIVWATEAHRESLRQRLDTQGVDVAAATQQGRFLSLDVSDPPHPVRMLEAIRGLREAASNMGKKDPRVAVCGERAGCLWAEGKTDEAIRLEQLCNELAKSQDVDILCPYPVPSGPKDDPGYQSICAQHTAIVEN